GLPYPTPPRPPPKPPTGRPPPMILPKVVRSGRRPSFSWAPPQAVRNEITSSRIIKIPSRSVTSRSRGRKPSTGGSRPPLHMYGSTMTAAMAAPSLVRISSHASGSFHGNTTVFLSTAGGMPADHASGLGRRGGPHDLLSPVTLTMTHSWVPWKAPSNLASLGREVNARARRTAFMVASVPELVKRRLSTEGRRRGVI